MQKNLERQEMSAGGREIDSGSPGSFGVTGTDYVDMLFQADREGNHERVMELLGECWNHSEVPKRPYVNFVFAYWKKYDEPEVNSRCAYALWEQGLPEDCADFADDLLMILSHPHPGGRSYMAWIFDAYLDELQFQERHYKIIEKVISENPHPQTKALLRSVLDHRYENER
jgi:hypothetical protein